MFRNLKCRRKPTADFVFSKEPTLASANKQAVQASSSTMKNDDVACASKLRWVYRQVINEVDAFWLSISRRCCSVVETPESQRRISVFRNKQLACLFRTRQPSLVPRKWWRRKHGEQHGLLIAAKASSFHVVGNKARAHMRAEQSGSEKMSSERICLQAGREHLHSDWKNKAMNAPSSWACTRSARLKSVDPFFPHRINARFRSSI